MITSDIQELFDGTLGDEQAAELFHALSVSPERRTDFNRHVALQDAMHGDRHDNRLSSDEDAAVWGAITGLGVATTAATSGTSSAWATKIVFFVLSGVVGYILGTTSFGDIFGNGSSANAPASAGARQIAPFVVVPMPAGPSSTALPTPARPDAGTALSSNRPAAQARTNGTRPRDLASANAIANNNGSTSNAARPNSMSDGAVSTPRTDNGGNGGATNTVTNSANQNSQSSSVPSANSTNTVTPSAPIDTTKAQTPDVIASRPATPVDPQQALANSTNTSNSPLGDDDTPVAALTSNGFEVGYGHSVGLQRQAMSSDGKNETYSNPHLNVSYRFAGGAIGIGGRMGLGNFSVLVPGTRSNNTDGVGIIRTDRIDTLGSGSRQLALLELFADYRILLGNKLALNLEGSFGGSMENHLQAGGKLSLVYFVSDRIGIQGGVGINRYWYNVSSGILPNLNTEGASVEYNSYIERSGGTIFSANYGAFFHF